MKLIEAGLDLGKIAQSGQCFRWEKPCENTYRIPHAGLCLYIRMLEPGAFELDCSEEEFETVWRAYFDLSTDYAAISSRIDPASDPFLYAAMKDQKGVRILRQDPWEMMITSIITQNRNIPAIQKSVELLSRFGGEKRIDRRNQVYYTFPSPGQLTAMDDSVLSRCRLGYRMDYVGKTAEAVCSGTADPGILRTLPDRECREQLLGLYGVGDKVAACIMLFGLHRLNAFPRDVWINRMLKEEYPDGFPFGKYAPYNGIFQQYLFAYYRKCFSARERSSRGGV